MSIELTELEQRVSRIIGLVNICGCIGEYEDGLECHADGQPIETDCEDCAGKYIVAAVTKARQAEAAQ